MPVVGCQSDNKPGFKWGPEGKCFTYSSDEGKQEAKNKAAEQGRAIEASRNN